MLRLRLVTAICILVLLSSLAAFGQDIPSINFTTKDGLPSNTIYEIYRDSKGFLWFATDKGIARYNGQKFEIFTTFDGLPDNEIFFFQEDKYGRLWLGTFNGELCYYENDTFHNSYNTPLLKIPFKVSFIQSITPLSDSNIIIAFSQQNKYLDISRNGLNIISSKSIPVSSALLGCQREHDSLLKMEFNGTTVYINTINEVQRIEKNNYGSIKRLFAQNTDYLFNDSVIFNRDYKQLGKLRSHFFDKYSLFRIYYHDSNLFLATNTSLIINDSIEILKGNKISSVTSDINGNYWIGSTTTGAYLIKKKFLNTKYYNNAYNGVAKYAYSYHQHFFFTTNKELYSLENSKIKLQSTFPLYKEQAGTALPEPICIIDTSFHFFSFTTQQIMTCDNLLHKPIKFNCHKQNEFSIKSLVFVKEDIYAKCINSLVRFSDYKMPYKTGATMPATNIYKNPERIFGMAKSPDEHIWYSTVGNMYRIDGDNEHMQPQFKNYVLKYFDFFGDYLLGYTFNNQLLLFKNYYKTVAADSIPSQNCIWDRFYQLDSNHILVSTNDLYHLLTITPDNPSRKFTVSTIEDPFIPLQAEVICTSGDKCYFFKNGSITSVDINSLFTKPAPPLLQFNRLITGYKTYAITDKIEIPYRESKAISIRFNTISFGGKDVFYQYSVSKTKEDDWRDFTGQINLAHIDWGDYKIKVRAKSYSSEYSKPIEFTLYVQSPFWATAWFILLVIFTAVLAISIIGRYWISTLLKIKEKKHLTEVRFIKSEYRALNALMNPHFIFNTLNNVQDLINKNDKLAANEYLRIFADLIRQNMHNISKELISLQMELDLIKNYLLLEKLRFEDKLNYDFNIDPCIDLSEIMVPPLLVQPLVENSIKHGILQLKSGNGFISINVYESNDVLFIVIKDNGVGINFPGNNSPTHESYGLGNTKDRVAKLSLILNKQITFNIGEERNRRGKLLWTVVTITMAL